MKLDWYRDPSASGMRSRAWPGEGEIVVYDNGNWFVFLKAAKASGQEKGHDEAMAKAVAIYRCLTARVKP